ncbi:MAG: hypothetical protein JWP12_2592 [Bacteroidetes bacterium]|nr:hypothetical protein [Bacteroidota bacterium]
MKEYKIIRLNVASENIIAAEIKLNDFAKDGWAIVSVNSGSVNATILVYTLEKFITP